MNVSNIYYQHAVSIPDLLEIFTSVSYNAPCTHAIFLNQGFLSFRSFKTQWLESSTIICFILCKTHYALLIIGCVCTTGVLHFFPGREALHVNGFRTKNQCPFRGASLLYWLTSHKVCLRQVQYNSTCFYDIASFLKVFTFNNKLKIVGGHEKVFLRISINFSHRAVQCRCVVGAL